MSVRKTNGQRGKTYGQWEKANGQQHPTNGENAQTKEVSKTLGEIHLSAQGQGPGQRPGSGPRSAPRVRARVSARFTARVRAQAKGHSPLLFPVRFTSRGIPSPRLQSSLHHQLECMPLARVAPEAEPRRPRHPWSFRNPSRFLCERKPFAYRDNAGPASADRSER